MHGQQNIKIMQMSSVHFVPKPPEYMKMKWQYHVEQ